MWRLALAEVREAMAEALDGRELAAKESPAAPASAASESAKVAEQKARNRINAWAVWGWKVAAKVVPLAAEVG